MAQLRRMNPRSPTEELFWRVCIELGIDSGEQPTSSAVIETWGEIAKMIAQGTKVTDSEIKGPHDGAVPFGRALAEANYSNTRFKTLLNADDSAVIDRLNRATAYLNAKGQRFNWNDAARLALTKHRGQEDREYDRTRIARDYYRTLHAAE